MATATEIANAAVSKLGDVPIQRLPERGTGAPDVPGPGATQAERDAFAAFYAANTEAALMCGATYYIHRDAMLAAYPWSWAKRRVPLDRQQPAGTDRPDHTPLYPNTFWLPSGAEALGIGVRAVYRGREDYKPVTRGWARYGDGITARYDALWADYIEDVDEEQWPPLVVNALVLKLCAEWAYYFTDQANLKQMYEAEYTMAFNEAKRVDVQSKPSEGIREFSLIEARYRGAGRRLEDGAVVPANTFWADGGTL